MKSSDVPHLAPKKSEPKAEAEPRVEAKPRKAEPKPAPKPEPKPEPKLARASESSDPTVHSLLVKRHFAEQRGDAAAAAEVTAKLATLGYK